MNDKFEVEGDLWLCCQEGGFADDAWVLETRNPSGFVEELANAITNLHLGMESLDDMVAKHFGAEYTMPSGNRHIGLVRITIERIDDAV